MKKPKSLLSNQEALQVFGGWLKAWNDHNLDGVMSLFHDDVLFENWTGSQVKGKMQLLRAWGPWFRNHGGFRFHQEDFFFDAQEQKALFQWRLEWPVSANDRQGKLEIRRGVDVIHFEDKQIIRKLTYTKTKVDTAFNKQ